MAAGWQKEFEALTKIFTCDLLNSRSSSHYGGKEIKDMVEKPSLTPFPTPWGNQAVVTAGWMRQFEYLLKLYDKIIEVSGDIVECGIGMGGTFSMLAYLIGRENRSPKRILRGFDSFEGWPEPDVSDRSWRQPQKGEWKVPQEYVETVLEKSEIREAFPDVQIEFIPGFLGDTLPLEKKKGYAIAFLHLDVDLYPSYRDGLTYLFPLVSPGGIVCFDEYKEFSSKEYPEEEKWPGATKAIDEYLSPRGYTPTYNPLVKKYFIVKR